eukprot:8710638-Alexandrium_andersonii.AAC.1
MGLQPFPHLGDVKLCDVGKRSFSSAPGGVSGRHKGDRYRRRCMIRSRDSEIKGCYIGAFNGPPSEFHRYGNIIDPPGVALSKRSGSQ